MSTPGYLAATTAVAGFDRTDLEWWTFRGRDPARMLSGVVTGRMPGLPNPVDDRIALGEATMHTVLTPKGRMVGSLWLAAEPGFEDQPDWLWAIVPTAASEGLQAHLGRYLPPRFAKLEVADAFEVFSLVGPAADDLVARVVLNGAVDADALAALPAGGTVVVAPAAMRLVRGDELATPSWHLVGEPGAMSVLRQKVSDEGVVRATLDDWRVMRVEAGTPAYGEDMDDSTIPPEAGLEDAAIDHAKGCYTGQEVIVRIRDRGHVNRKLLRIELGDIDPPAAGTEVFVAGRDKPAAEVRSSVRSPRFGQTVALAYVRREVWTGEGDAPEFSLGG